MTRLLSKRNVLLFLTVLFFLIAWNREINLLYGMFSLLASILAVSFVLPRHSLKHITGSRSLPSAAFEGEEIQVSVVVENSDWRSRYMLEVSDNVPAAETDFQSPMTFIGKLRGRNKKKYSYPISCHKRGEYSIGPLKIGSSYPLGVSAAEKTLQDDLLPLLVYPRVFEIARLPFLRGSSVLTAISDSAVKTGGGEDFYGTREYRRGDSLRYIHWPSSARQGQLIVKEFETRAAEQVTLILDLQRGSDFGEGRETTLEYAVRIAASFARHILERGHGLQLIGYGKGHNVLPYGRGLAQLSKVLEALAKMQADGNLPYPAAISRASDLLREGDSAVLFFCRGDETAEEYAYCIALMQAKRVRPVPIFLNRESFLDKGKAPLSKGGLREEFMGLGAPVYSVSRGDNLEEIF